MDIDLNDITNINNIIDIREKNGYNHTRFKNIPKNVLLQNPERYLNKDEEYYLICYSGMQSMFASKILNAIGYKCYSIKGGINGIKNM